MEKHSIFQFGQPLPGVSSKQVLVRGDFLAFQRKLNGEFFNLRADHKNAYVEFKFDGKNLKNGQLSKTGSWKAFHDTGKRNN